MRFIYACDIHGDEYKYMCLLEQAIKNNIKYLVLGGDLLPKECGDRFNEQKIFIEEYLNNYFEVLNKNDIKCICILGNDDLEILDKNFKDICRKHENVFNIDQKKANFEDVTFIGLSKVLDHPFGCKDRVVIEKGLDMPFQLSSIIYVDKCQNMLSIEEWREYRKHIEKMEDILERLPKVKKGNKAIYVFHNPPFGIGLDVCVDKRQVGSKAITSFLEKSNAYMSLHGHIHESYRVTGIWKNELIGTTCIQTGQTERHSKDMFYAIVDTDTNYNDLYMFKG